MYRLCSGLFIILVLNGCAIIDGSLSARLFNDDSRQKPLYEAEKQALFDQPYIDPLTDYLIEHQTDPTRDGVLQLIRQERDQRCKIVAEQYAEQLATEQVLKQYNVSYGYSCPQQVARFEERLVRERATVSDDTDPDTDTTLSDQARSDCYLLTTIRNFSAAREACLAPAKQGDIRSQLNMAVVAYAFEDYASAFEWAQEAAPESGDAAFLLGQMYANGRGVDQNMDRAVYWYQEAVRQGNSEAQQAIDNLLGVGSDGES